MWLAWVQDLLLSLFEHLGLSLRRDCKVHVCTFLNGLRMPPLIFTFKGQAQSHKHASDVCLTFIWGGIFLLCLIRTSGTLKKEHKPTQLNLVLSFVKTRKQSKPGYMLGKLPRNLSSCWSTGAEPEEEVEVVLESHRQKSPARKIGFVRKITTTSFSDDTVHLSSR